MKEKRKRLEATLVITSRRLVFTDFKSLFSQFVKCCLFEILLIFQLAKINLYETFVNIVIKRGLSIKLDNSLFISSN